MRGKSQSSLSEQTHQPGMLTLAAIILGQPLCNTVFLNSCILRIKALWVMQLNSLNSFAFFSPQEETLLTSQ